jgi:Coenzyme PQQ synthesis protein D (PqqD)
MQTAPLETRIQRVCGVPWRSVADRVWLAPRGSTHVDELRSGAAAVWLALDEPRSAQEIADLVASGYGEPFDAVLEGVQETLDLLLTSGTIEVVR